MAENAAYSPRLEILRWALVLKFQKKVNDGEMSVEEAVRAASAEYTKAFNAAA